MMHLVITVLCLEVTKTYVVLRHTQMFCNTSLLKYHSLWEFSQRCCLVKTCNYTWKHVGVGNLMISDRDSG